MITKGINFRLIFFLLDYFLSAENPQFALRFTEEGTTVREEIDVDVEGKTEVIRVPAHNNKAPMDVMNDFISVSNIMCVNESYELVNILACKKTLQWIYFP